MNILHVIAGMGPEKGGPPASLLALRSAMLRRAQVHLELHTVGPSPVTSEGLHRHEASRLFPFLKYSPHLQKELRKAAAKADILHSHGLWLMPNFYCAHAVRGRACSHLISPHGMLSEHALDRKRLRKTALMATVQGWALRNAACLHATSHAELDDIRRLNIKVPVAVIPNGVEVPLEEKRLPQSLPRRIVFVGRLHPIKGIDRLLQAWQSVFPQRTDWQLSIVGPDTDGQLAKLKQMSRALGLTRVSFEGPAFGNEKSEWLRSAELFVLPSHSENFGLAAAEAMAHGVPVIVSTGTPWSGVQRRRCGWWVPNDSDSLSNALLVATSLSRDDLHEHGVRGRKWMEDAYSWDDMSRRMHETYLWLRSRGRAPEWVDEPESLASSFFRQPCIPQ